MHTSYYGNIKNLPRGKTIAISQGIPHWYHGAENKQLAPSWEMIKIKEAAVYDRMYAEILAKLDPEKEYEAMESLVGGGAILLCWEKPGQDCHRRLVAVWFETNLGIEVPEYGRLQMELIPK